MSGRLAHSEDAIERTRDELRRLITVFNRQRPVDQAEAHALRSEAVRKLQRVFHKNEQGINFSKCSRLDFRYKGRSYSDDPAAFNAIFNNGGRGFFEDLSNIDINGPTDADNIVCGFRSLGPQEPMPLDNQFLSMRMYFEGLQPPTDTVQHRIVCVVPPDNTPGQSSWEVHAKAGVRGNREVDIGWGVTMSCAVFQRLDANSAWTNRGSLSPDPNSSIVQPDSGAAFPGQNFDASADGMGLGTAKGVMLLDANQAVQVRVDLLFEQRREEEPIDQPDPTPVGQIKYKAFFVNSFVQMSPGTDGD